MFLLGKTAIWGSQTCFLVEAPYMHHFVEQTKGSKTRRMEERVELTVVEITAVSRHSCFFYIGIVILYTLNHLTVSVANKHMLIGLVPTSQRGGYMMVLK